MNNTPSNNTTPRHTPTPSDNIPIPSHTSTTPSSRSSPSYIPTPMYSNIPPHPTYPHVQPHPPHLVYPTYPHIPPQPPQNYTPVPRLPMQHNSLPNNKYHIINPNLNSNTRNDNFLLNNSYNSKLNSMYIWDFGNNIKYTVNHENKYHSFNDMPALEYLNDSTTRMWMKNGYVHRDNKPAYIKMIDYLGFPEKVEYREYYNTGHIYKKCIAYFDVELNKVIEFKI